MAPSRNYWKELLQPILEPARAPLESSMLYPDKTKERKKQNKQTHQRALTHDVCGFSCSSRAGAFQMCAVPSRAQLPLAPADGWQLSKNAELFWMFILTSFPCAQMVCLRPFEQEVVGSSWLLIPAGARSQLWIEHCLLLTLSLGRDHWRNHWDWWL